MPRRPRFDEPGCLHHVMSRGLARRTIFETRGDARYFLALWAWASKRGQVELHAYSLMSTHFHLLVRSLDGQLSETMRWVLNRYVRHFNRTRRRDGPLMRGRFKSIPVRSVVYLRTLIRYIDQNAIDAGLVARPEDYPYGSARWLRQVSRKPLWLSRTLVDETLARHAPGVAQRGVAYDTVFAPRLSDRQKVWIDRRLDGRARGFCELDRLLGDSQRVAAWAWRKAQLADGTEPGLAILDPATAMETVDLEAGRLADVIARPRSGRMRPAVPLMKAALLRDAAGESFVAIARRLQVSSSTPQHFYRLHRECMEDPQYREAYTEALRSALRALHIDGPTTEPACHEEL